MAWRWIGDGSSGFSAFRTIRLRLCGRLSGLLNRLNGGDKRVGDFLLVVIFTFRHQCPSSIQITSIWLSGHRLNLTSKNQKTTCQTSPQKNGWPSWHQILSQAPAYVFTLLSLNELKHWCDCLRCQTAQILQPSTRYLANMIIITTITIIIVDIIIFIIADTTPHHGGAETSKWVAKKLH